MSEERVVVGRVVIRVPAPDRFFTTLSPVRGQELERVRDQASAELMEISKGIESLLEAILRDVSTPSAMVLHPDFDRITVYDRIARLFAKAGNIIRSSASEMAEALSRPEVSGGDVERQILRFFATYRLVLLALREAMARLLVIYHSNLPAELRPPVANVVLGFDQLAPR